MVQRVIARKLLAGETVIIPGCKETVVDTGGSPTLHVFGDPSLIYLILSRRIGHTIRVYIDGPVARKSLFEATGPPTRR